MTQVEKNAKIVQKIRELCKNSGISVTTLEKELHFGNGSIGKWAKAPKAPPYDRIFAIAQHFHTTPEEITGENETPSRQGERLEDVYLHFARQAQDQGIAPSDIQLAIETIKRLRGES